jgi:DNA-binding transcriptional ArsR family regulator
LRSFKYISDPKAFEVIADETRRRAIYLLRVKEQTVSQLAEALSLTPQAVYRQIRKLVEAGLVEVAKEERVDHFIETYYRASAEVFEFRHGEPGARGLKNELKEALEVLSKTELTLRMDDRTVDRLAKSWSVYAAQKGLDPHLEEQISEQPDVGFLIRQDAYRLAQLMTVDDDHFEEMLSSQRELRQLLRSSIGKTGKTSVSQS